MPSTWWKAADLLRVNAITALACFGGALLGWALQLGTTSLPQNWPQVGIGLVAAWAFGYRAYFGLWLVYFLTVDVTAVRAPAWSSPLLSELAVSAILAGQVLLSAYFLQVPRGQNPLATRRGVGRLFLFSGLLAALAGNSLRYVVGLALELPHLDLFTRFAYRLSKYVSGVMLISPLVFMLYLKRRPHLRPRIWAELALIVLLLAAVTSLASIDIFSFLQAYQQMLILLILPFTLWATLRAGSWGASISIFVAALFPIWGTLRGSSAFGVPASTTSEILVHLYLVTVSVTTLTVGAVLKEQSRAAKELHEAKRDLEATVQSRTADLRRERDFGSAIFDTIGALVFVIHEDGTIVRINKTCRSFIGRALEDVRGKVLWDLGLIPEEEVELVKERFSSASSGENHLIASDGSRRLFQWTNTWLEPGLESEKAFLVAVGIDVTEARKAQEEALDAIQARDLFLSVASHELRTPLTTLQLQLQSLKRFVDKTGDLPSEIETRLVSALRQTRRLGDLINELLDVSRITHGRLLPERVETDLAAIVREVLERYRVSIEQAGSELIVRGLDESIVGFWDPLRLDQIVDNLLSNAIKYGEGRPIILEIARVDGKARLVVTDHGIGISPQDQERIFERFERAVSTRYYGGFGLGLWITRQVVEAHGGAIHVESELGRGSTFTVELPLRAKEAGTQT